MTTARPAKGPLTGIGLMLAAMASLPFIDVLAKYLGQWGLPILIIVWARLAFGALAVLPLAAGLGPLWPGRPIFHSFRAGFLALATFCFFYALKFLPMADALAIFFVQPLIVTILSGLFLREAVGPARWAAVAVGFVGTLVIIRPGLQEINPGTILAFAAGAFLAVYFVLTRRISGQAPAMLTTFHTNLMGALLLSLALPLVWQMPTALEWAMLAGLGLIASYGHFLIVRAYDFAEASLLAPFAYTEIIMSALLGWAFFGDFPDGWTFLGVAILVGSSLVLARIETRNEGSPPPA